jgi:hypothetical protein
MTGSEAGIMVVWTQRIAPLLLIVALLCARALPGQAEADPSVGAVRAVLDRQVADWNRGDLDGFLGGYWNSPKVVFQSGGRRYDGWEAMRERDIGSGTRRRAGRWAGWRFRGSTSSRSGRRPSWRAADGN